MNQNPRIELLAERAAVRQNRETTLRVLVRISAPEMPKKTETERPKLNLALVLDRSGSMGGDKLRFAKAATRFAIEQLGDHDRASLTIYDSDVEVLAPSQNCADKSALLAALERVQCGGATALHGGWVEGATQVAAHMEKGGLNRVLLLTDGLANEGETNPSRICADVKKLGATGVSTTTLGVGRDFNEDLLSQMSDAGDGNYYFIESPRDLERIFAAELQGLMATWGQTISLGIEGQNGVELGDVLNEFERNSYGRLQLPNLRAGSPIEIALTLKIPAASAQNPQTLALFRVAWTLAENGRREVVREALQLPVVSESEWENLPVHPFVAEKFAILDLARQRERMHVELERGNFEAARASSHAMREQLRSAPISAPMQAAESALFDALDESIERGDAQTALKSSKYHSLRRRKSRED